MIQLFIKLQSYIMLYVLGNLPYSKYVITPESIGNLHQHIQEYMEKYPTSYSIPKEYDLITPDYTSPLTEMDFIEILNKSIYTLEHYNFQDRFIDERGIIVEDLKTWLNILYSH